jgi:UDP-GlcNAc:undecaprenyl-phosphate/decaprenyl-phosphate GlcNAc-1-phosphate transferase
LLAAAIAFVIALVAALALTPVVRSLALRVGAIDHAHAARKIHRQPTPRLGGLAIVGGFFMALAVVALADQATHTIILADRHATAALLAGALVIAGLGLQDDLHGLTAGNKLTVELAVAGLLYAAGYRIDTLALPFLEPIALGWMGLPLTLLWIAGVTNAVNLIDGLDGLAAGVAAVAAVATGLLAFVGGSPLVVILAAALAGAALGFLRHNFNPASIFMGDTGSLFLGFVLAALSLRTHHESSTAVGLLASALVLGVPIADTTLAVGRRALRAAPLFRADRGHLHHQLLASGLGHRGAVLILYGASVLLSGAAVLLTLGDDALAAVVLATLAVACPAALWRAGVLRAPRLEALLEVRRRNQALHADVRRASDRLRGAADLGELWPEVRRAADQLGAVGVELQLAVPAGGDHGISYVAGATKDGLLCTRSPLAQELGSGCLELRWRDRATLDRDTEIAVEILCGEVTSAIARIRRRRRWAPSDLPALSTPDSTAARAERGPAA